MKTIVVIFILCFASILNSQEKKKDVKVDGYAGPWAIGEYLKSTLPDGWSCSYDFSKIIIKKKELIVTLNIISRKLGRSIEDYVKKEGIKGSYIITLHFVPRLNKKEYHALNGFIKNQLSKVSPDDAQNKNRELNRMHQLFLRPKYYNEQYSVYSHRTDESNYLRVFPKSAEDEIKLVLKLINTVLQRY